MESLQKDKNNSEMSKRYSTINKVGLIAISIIILINIFVQIGVSNHIINNKKLCYNILYFLPYYIIPFIILFSISKKYSAISFRLFLGAIIILILSSLTLIITGDLGFFLGDYGRNLYSGRIKIWAGISVFLGILNAILKNRE